MPGNDRKKILIADNDEGLLIAFEHALETAGYDTAVALNAGEMFSMLSRTRFDVVVLDDYLSDEGCFGVLARLQQAGVRPAVVVTHHRFPPHEVQEQLRSLGVCAFVNKRVRVGLPRIVDFLLQAQKGSNDGFNRTT